MPVRRLYLGAGSERGGMKLPAHGAMTVQNVSQRPVNFVLNASAETATRLFHSYTSLSNNIRLSEKIFDGAFLCFAKKDDSEKFPAGAIN